MLAFTFVLSPAPIPQGIRFAWFLFAGMTIVPYWIVDREVLAGVKVQIKDKVIDGTAASMLQLWKERLTIGRS